VPKPKRSRSNTGKKQGGGFRPFLYLALTAVLIILLFYFLEKHKKPEPVKPPSKPSFEQPQVSGKPSRKPKIPETLREPEQPAIPVKPEQPVKHPPVREGCLSPAVTAPPVKHPEVPGTATIAVIIDDMGTSVREVRSLMEIGVPLTFSIIPGLREAREVAETAHAGGYDVMLHIPMEPMDYPARRLEANGLLLAYSDNEIEKRVRGLIQSVPHAVGANNHMGSRFTQDRDKMRAVLGVLKENGMYFVDSMTTPKSVGLSLAREMGLRATARNAPFIDNSADVGAIKAQLASLERLARKNGSVVGICHPHGATIRALTEELPRMRDRGISFVYVSQLLR